MYGWWRKIQQKVEDRLKDNAIDMMTIIGNFTD